MDYHAQENVFVRIEELNSSVAGGILVGLVTGKHKMRTFPDNKGGPNRSVFSFMLRDSRRDSTIIHVWGSELFVQQLEQNFCINDCGTTRVESEMYLFYSKLSLILIFAVEVSNFQVHIKNDSEAKFNPTTTSDFSIHLSERNNGVIIKHNGQFLRECSKFKNTPICKENDFYTLQEASEMQENSHYVNLLACVKKIGNRHNVTTKLGKKLCKVELTLLDETMDSFSLIIWDDNTVTLSQEWIEMCTIIFVVDALVQFNNYKKAVTASSTSKTVFICNPNTNEAHRLYQYAQEYCKTMVEDVDEDIGGFEAKVATIEEINHGLHTNTNNPTSHIRAILYGAVTQMDIDSSLPNLHSYRCSSCGYTVDEENPILCKNTSCVTSTQGETMLTLKDYDIRASISDHTGTLNHCRINSKVSQKMFKMPLEEFLELGVSDRTSIKWKWLLERCKFTLKCSLSRNGNPFTCIESCEIANCGDLMLNNA